MFKQWVKQAHKQGWEIREIKSGVMIIPPQGDPIVLHMNHSKKERGNLVGYKSKLRRAGLDI